MGNDYVLNRLSKSKFRNSFHLKQQDINYIVKNGMEKIRIHAIDFVRKRLSNNDLFVDGKQTPTKGHPVFIAQHATATCCRECLFKWHGIEKTHMLLDCEVDYIVDLIMAWIIKNSKEIKNG